MFYRNILTVTVRFRSVVDGVKIYYTKDGSDPNINSPSIVANTPVLINTLGWVTVKCMAVKQGMQNSVIVAKAYHIIDQCNSPTLLPNGGTYQGFVTITLLSNTPLTKVCYNIDKDTDPNSKDSSCLDSGSQITLNTAGTHVVKALAEEEGKAPSEVTVATFHILAQVATPVIFPAAVSTFPVSAMLTISCATAGATIYYTLDGSTPTMASLTVENGQSIIVDTVGRYTLKALATEPSMLASVIAVKVFVIQERMLEPKLLPPPGSFIGDLTLRLRCMINNQDDDVSADTVTLGTVFYTTDGISTPSELHSKSVSCDGTITITAPGTITLRAMAVSANKSASSVIQGVYTLRRPAADHHPINPAAEALRVQPDLDVIVVSKDLPDYYYCPKRNVRGRLVVLRNPIGHFDVVPPLGGCGSGKLELPSRSGRGFRPLPGFNLTGYIQASQEEEPKLNHVPAIQSHLRAGLPSSSKTTTVASLVQGVSPSDDLDDLTFRVREEFTGKLPRNLQKLLEQDHGSIRVQRLRELQGEFDAVDGLGCQLVSNAGFFNTSSSACIGDIVSSGTVHQLSELHNVNFGIRNGSFVTGYVTSEEVLDPAQPPFDFLVSGLGWLVRNGQSYVRESFSATAGDGESMAPQSTGPAFLTVHSARTALGHDREGNLLLLQVEGETWVRGMSLYEFADFAVELGFYSAINLDGGGSATMTQNHTLVSEPSWKCPDAPYNSSAYYRCEKRVSSITCIHAMAPPFIDPAYLRRFQQSATLPPSTAPTASPTSPAPTAPPSSSPVNAVDDDGSLPEPVNATANADLQLATLQSSLEFYELSSVLLLVALCASLATHILFFCFRRKSKNHQRGADVNGVAASSSWTTEQRMESGPGIEMGSVGDKESYRSQYAPIDAATSPPYEEARTGPRDSPEAHRGLVTSQPATHQRFPQSSPPVPTAAESRAPAPVQGLLMQHNTSPSGRGDYLKKRLQECAEKVEDLDTAGAHLHDAHDWHPSLHMTSGRSPGRMRTAEEEAFYRDDDEEEDDVDDRSRLLQGSDGRGKGRDTNRHNQQSSSGSDESSGPGMPQRGLYRKGGGVAKTSKLRPPSKKGSK